MYLRNWEDFYGDVGQPVAGSQPLQSLGEISATAFPAPGTPGVPSTKSKNMT